MGGGWWVTGGRHPSSLFGNGDEWFTSPEAVVVLLLGKVPGAMPNCQSGTRLWSLEGIIFALSISPDPRPSPSSPRPAPLPPVKSGHQQCSNRAASAQDTRSGDGMGGKQKLSNGIEAWEVWESRG